ncbi:hypothetical protein FYK55_23085 [Roseiconus nitratireducens]|uniref:TRASH domain-containing protein n=1 Tax=Roseiconus nitratireducens TaxID=2605748 RepID=A0A5M6CWU4_9BACT|nr:hypothetical protein [Roseiconus nitratireducens]KAA5539691.1 hypothetical protein FYK55_23085 [Roseiconus nitratireducens]
MRTNLATSVTLFAAFLLVVAGCNQSPDSDIPPQSETQNSTAASGDVETSVESEPTAAADSMPAGLKELDADDRTAAMQQKVCPVSGQSLGSMGAPKKIDVDGQSVWICCDSCEEKLLADPQKYLAKLEP